MPVRRMTKAQALAFVRGWAAAKQRGRKEPIKWCCPGFQGTVENAGHRGVGIFFDKSKELANVPAAASRD